MKIIVLHQPSGLQLWLKKRRWRGLAFLWDDLFSSFWPSVNGQSCRQVVEGKMFSHTRQGLPISSVRSRLWWERKLGYLENPLSKVKIDLTKTTHTMVVGVGGAKLKLVKPQEIPLVLECFLSNVSQSKVAVSRKKIVYVFFSSTSVWSLSETRLCVLWRNESRL